MLFCSHAFIFVLLPLRVLLFPNAAARDKSFKPTPANGLATVARLAVAVLHISRPSPFLYFNF